MLNLPKPRRGLKLLFDSQIDTLKYRAYFVAMVIWYIIQRL